MFVLPRFPCVSKEPDFWSPLHNKRFIRSQSLTFDTMTHHWVYNPAGNIIIHSLAFHLFSSGIILPFHEKLLLLLVVEPDRRSPGLLALHFKQKAHHSSPARG